MIFDLILLAAVGYLYYERYKERPQVLKTRRRVEEMYTAKAAE